MITLNRFRTQDSYQQSKLKLHGKIAGSEYYKGVVGTIPVSVKRANETEMALRGTFDNIVGE